MIAISKALLKQVYRKQMQLQTDYLSFAQISRESGVSERVLSSYATGKAKGIQFDQLEKLCKYFNCQPGDLLGLE